MKSVVCEWEMREVICIVYIDWCKSRWKHHMAMIQNNGVKFLGT